MNKKKYTIFLFFLFFANNLVFANDAKLTDLIVTNTRDDLLLYFDVEGAFQEKMETAILSGVPATFSFFVSLNQVRNLWFDKDIAEVNVTHTIKYNNLKKEFMVTRLWQDSEPVITPSFQEAKKLMSEIESLKIVPLDRLKKGRQYQLRAKAELNKMTLPFYLHYILFFVSLWDFETDLYTIDFIY